VAEAHQNRREATHNRHKVAQNHSAAEQNRGKAAHLLAQRANKKTAPKGAACI